MQVIVRGVHLSVTPALREYVDRHVVLPLEKFHTRDPVDVEVHLSRASKGDEAVECGITLKVPHLKTLHVSERGTELFACISLAGERLAEAVKRELEKVREPRAGAQDAPDSLP